MSLDLPSRPRRLRRTASIRGLVRETRLHPESLIYPMFVVDGEDRCEPISSMPGQSRWSVDRLVQEAARVHALGISAVNLFGYCPEEKKDAGATEAFSPEGVVPRAVAALKIAVPSLCVQTDVALDPYSADGHDGVVIDGEIANDESVDVLCQMALCHAEAGADWVTPSDMMDGRVAAIRETLDGAGYSHVGILSYSAKYASCFYGPFRGALDSTPRFGDKTTYQMDPANVQEALREVALDLEEGADVVMIKPGMPYLDVIAAVRQEFDVPVAAYQVSGEFGMIEAAAEKGWIDRERAILESLTALRRAGADMILTYFAPEAAGLLRSC